MSAATWRAYDDRQPTWSPDGTKIAFISNRSGKWQIYTMDAHGIHAQGLTSTATRDAYPAWSPDGTKIAFCTHRFGFWAICVAEAREESAPVILTNNPAIEECPAWSPDGQKIAYHSNRKGNYDIWVCDADGGRQTPLTSGDSTDHRPAWSPDGKKIAFHSNRAEPSGERRGDRQAIWVMDADGSNPQQLTRGPGNETSPAWSPDGSKVAFVSDEEGQKVVCIVDADGSSRRRLIALGATCDRPAWSLDGKLVAFDANPSGMYRIQTVASDGTGRRELSAEEPARAPVGAPAAAPTYRTPVPPRPTPRPAPQPTAPTSSRFLATRARAGASRSRVSSLVRLLLLAGVAIALYYGVNWLLGRQTKPVLAEEPTVTQEISECSVTYTIRNEGKSGLIRANVTVIMDDGEKIQSPAPLGTHRFGRGEVKTFTETFTVRSDRQVKEVKVELHPKPR